MVEIPDRQLRWNSKQWQHCRSGDVCHSFVWNFLLSPFLNRINGIFCPQTVPCFKVTETLFDICGFVECWDLDNDDTSLKGWSLKGMATLFATHPRRKSYDWRGTGCSPIFVQYCCDTEYLVYIMSTALKNRFFYYFFLKRWLGSKVLNVSK